MRIPVAVGFNTQYQPCGFVENVPCPKCRYSTRFTKLKLQETGSVMFVPVAKYTQGTYVGCEYCKTLFDVLKTDFDSIRTPDDVYRAMQNRQNYEQQQRAAMRQKYSVGFSPKNQTVAVLLAVLFTTFGAPFFYVGKPLYGIACLLASVLSCVFLVFPLMFAIVLVGFAYAAMLALGKVKDKNGLYIASERQKQNFMR